MQQLRDDPATRQTPIVAFTAFAMKGDPERFLAGGGRRGRQHQVLVEGTYYVNRLFATVELVPKTVVEVGNVGVVISYTGAKGDDLSGADYTHGEMVEQGKRGVWSVPLLPGKYAFNTYAGQIVMVPTTNIILKWIRNQSGSHKLDENLADRREIKRRIRQQCSPRHVPDEVYAIAEVPRTLSGKVLEVPVKRILTGTPAETAASRDSLANPAALDYFVEFAGRAGADA